MQILISVMRTLSAGEEAVLTVVEDERSIFLALGVSICRLLVDPVTMDTDTIPPTS